MEDDEKFNVCECPQPKYRSVYGKAHAKEAQFPKLSRGIAKAAFNGDLDEIIAWRSEKDENLNAVDIAGWTILMHAIWGQQFPVSSWFVRQTDAHLNLQDSKGSTSLMMAVQQGCPHIVELLTKSQTKCIVDIDMKNDEEETAIDIAENKELPEIVTMLSEGRKKLVMTAKWIKAADDQDLDELVAIREDSFDDVETAVLEMTKDLAENLDNIVVKSLLIGAYHKRLDQLHEDKKQQFNDSWIEATHEGDHDTLARMMGQNFDLINTETLEKSVEVAEELEDMLTKQLCEGAIHKRSTSAVSNLSQLTDCISPDEDCYDNLKRGQVHIFNYFNFPDPKDKRNGAAVDSRALHETFTDLGYDVYIYENLTATKTGLKFEEIRQDESLEEVGSLIIFVLSHGLSSYSFMTSDGYNLDIDKFRREFTNHGCPHMKGKPKLLLCNFCRGTSLEKFERESTLAQIESPHDMVTIHAATDGVMPLRFPTKGSVFVVSLCRVLKKNPQLELREVYNELYKEMEELGGTTPMWEDFPPFKRFVF